MASLPVQTLFTPEEYITQERKALHKSEYLNGQILAMSGASRAQVLSQVTYPIDFIIN